MNTETITAIATPPGIGGVGIIRISGPAARELLGRFFDFGRKELEPRRALFGWAVDESGNRLDSGIALYFPAPASYTGEDVAEMQLHGSPHVLNLLVRKLCESGRARLAEPGEFTRRALVNGKISVEEAERLDLLIHAETAYESRIAAATRGRLGKMLADMRERLIQSMAAIEAGIEYPDEEMETGNSFAQAMAGLEQVASGLAMLVARFEQLRPVWQGLKVVLTGPPNVGKSSLLNRMVGFERVLVTDRPGTTRDAVSVDMVWQGRKLTLVDTAGVRPAGEAIERLGIAHGDRERADADVIVDIRDVTRPTRKTSRMAVSPGSRVIRVVNKIDLGCGNIASDELGVSAVTGEGIDSLLDRLVGSDSTIPDDGMVLFTQRQYQAAKEAGVTVEAAREALVGDMPEVAQRELQDAVMKVDVLTGRITTEEMLDELFSGFCLGK